MWLCQAVSRAVPTASGAQVCKCRCLPQHLKKSRQMETEMLYGSTPRTPIKRRMLSPHTPAKVSKVKCPCRTVWWPGVLPGAELSLGWSMASSWPQPRGDVWGGIRVLQPHGMMSCVTCALLSPQLHGTSIASATPNSTVRSAFGGTISHSPTSRLPPSGKKVRGLWGLPAWGWAGRDG